MLSCDVIIWDDNTPLFVFPGNFTHSHPLPSHPSHVSSSTSRTRDTQEDREIEATCRRGKFCGLFSPFFPWLAKSVTLSPPLLQPWGRILGENPDRSLKSFLVAIHSHLYSFALTFLFLQTHATSYSFYSSVTPHCKGEWIKTTHKGTSSLRTLMSSASVIFSHFSGGKQVVWQFAGRKTGICRLLSTQAKKLKGGQELGEGGSLGGNNWKLTIHLLNRELKVSFKCLPDLFCETFVLVISSSS